MSKTRVPRQTIRHLLQTILIGIKPVINRIRRQKFATMTSLSGTAESIKNTCLIRVELFDMGLPFCNSVIVLPIRHPPSVASGDFVG
jgi:hypothetical protein